MKKALALLLACTLALAACEPEGGGGGTAPAKPKPPAGGAQQPQPGAQQPAPVQGDPNAHNKQPGELDLHVEWTSENNKTPACEWSLNAPGLGHPCEGLQKGVQEPGVLDYIGFWEYSMTAQAGDVVFLSAQGNRGNKSIECAYFWKGAYHPFPSSGNRCGGTATLN